MSGAQPTVSVLDKFGMMLGVITGFLGTMPLYLYSYPYFYKLLLQYADYGTYEFWIIAWKIGLFFFILTATWFALILTMNVTRGILLSLFLLLKKIGR